MSRLSASGAASPLTSGDDLHDLRFLAVDGLVHVHDDLVVAHDDDLVAALDLLAGQRATLLSGALELRASGVAGEEVVGGRAAQSAGPHERELLLGVVVAQQPQALERLAGGGAFALDGFLDEAAV